MESYVEISLLVNVATIVLSLCLASYSIVQPIAVKQMLWYAICLSLMGCVCFFPYAFLLFLGIELLFFIAFFRRRKKLYVFAYAIRWCSFIFMFACFGGGFHNALYFFPATASILPLAALFTFLFIMLKYKWKQLLAKTNYVYDVALLLPDQTLSLKGYMDSGNLLTHEGIAVVFLDQSYQTYFARMSIELIVMNTVQATDVLKAYEAKIQMKGCMVHKAYICCEKQLHLPYEAELLLNINLMTLG